MITNDTACRTPREKVAKSTPAILPLRAHGSNWNKTDEPARFYVQVDVDGPFALGARDAVRLFGVGASKDAVRTEIAALANGSRDDKYGLVEAFYIYVRDEKSVRASRRAYVEGAMHALAWLCPRGEA